MPRIASAGIALSKYQRDEAYSETEPRRRFLWLELDEPGARSERRAISSGCSAMRPTRCCPTIASRRSCRPRSRRCRSIRSSIRVITPDAARRSGGTVGDDAAEAGRQQRSPFPRAAAAGTERGQPGAVRLLHVRAARRSCADLVARHRDASAARLRTTGVQHPAPTLFCTCQRRRDGAGGRGAVCRGRAWRARTSPPIRRAREIWALLYAQVRQADGKDWRNILLDDRSLELIPRVRGRTIDVTGALYLTGAFENRDAPARGATRWRQDEVGLLLAELGLPQDARLSVLCVEMMPRAEALRPRAAGGQSFSRTDIADASFLVLSGVAGQRQQDVARGPRPLSEALGHYRILRTSPLVAVPEACCPTC